MQTGWIVVAEHVLQNEYAIKNECFVDDNGCAEK